MIVVALALSLAWPRPAFVRGDTVKEEKVSHIFNLNAQRSRWGELFDAVAGAAMVIAPDAALTSRQQSDLVVAALFGSPDDPVHGVTDLVLSIAGAIAAGERHVVRGMLERGKPRHPVVVWSTAGRMVEIVRRVEPLEGDVVDRLIDAIRLIGTHPLMLGFPS